MLPYEDDIINVIDNAYKAGFNIPKYYFEKDYEQVKDSIEGEVYFCDPMHIIKPKGVEFTYIIFWNGHRFKGGYVAINNNYLGLQRGVRGRNGTTLFASHVPEIKRNLKRFTSDEPCWICHSFVMDEKGKLFYWGTDRVEGYVDTIERLVDTNFDELVQYYLNDGNTKKPVGFVSSVLVFDKAGELFECVGDVTNSITSSWKNLYEKADCLRRDLWFTPGLESYMRSAYAKLTVMGKLK